MREKCILRLTFNFGLAFIPASEQLGLGLMSALIIQQVNQRLYFPPPLLPSLPPLLPSLPLDYPFFNGPSIIQDYKIARIRVNHRA